MTEILLATVLITLLLIFLLLKSWLPKIAKYTFINYDNYEQRIDAEITIKKQQEFDEDFTISSLGLSKKINLDVMLETMYFMDHEDKSKYFHAELRIYTFEKIEELISDENGYIVKIKYNNSRIDNSSTIDLFCSNESYEFMKKQINENSLLNLHIENGKQIKNKESENILIKAKNIKLNYEDSFRSINSLKRFIKRYKNNYKIIENSYLLYWLEDFKNIEF